MKSRVLVLGQFVNVNVQSQVTLTHQARDRLELLNHYRLEMVAFGCSYEIAQKRHHFPNACTLVVSNGIVVKCLASTSVA